METTTYDRIARQLEPFARAGVLPFLARVDRFDSFAGWVSEAQGSTVAWIAGSADAEADFGPVRVVALPSGEVIAR